MHHWYVVQTLSAQEKKVKKTIEEQRDLKGMTVLIEDVLLPVENVSEVKKGQQKIVEKRMWPGYLLVKMALTDESWDYIASVPGVIGFLGGDKPTPLTQKEVEEILSDIEDKKRKVVQKHQFEVGNTVKIVEGVFVNFVGTVTEVQHEKGKISVLVSIFGRDTRVDDLDFSQVEEVTEENKS